MVGIGRQNVYHIVNLYKSLKLSAMGEVIGALIVALSANTNRQHQMCHYSNIENDAFQIHNEIVLGG